MSKLKLGDRVVVSNPDHPDHGKTGRVACCRLYMTTSYYDLLMDDPSMEGTYYHESKNLSHYVEPESLREFKAGDRVRLDGYDVRFLHCRADDGQWLVSLLPDRLTVGLWAAEGRLTLDPERDEPLLTSDAMLKLMKAHQRHLIAEAGYSLPKPRIVGQPSENLRPVEMNIRPGDPVGGVSREEIAAWYAAIHGLKSASLRRKIAEPSVATVLEGVARWQIANSGCSVDSFVGDGGYVRAGVQIAKGSSFFSVIEFPSPVTADEAFARIEAAVNVKDTP